MRKFIIKTPKQIRNIKFDQKLSSETGARSFLSSRIGFQHIQQIKKEIQIVKHNNHQKINHLDEIFDQINQSEISPVYQTSKPIQFKSSQLQSYENPKRHKSHKKQLFTEPNIQPNIRLSRILESKSKKVNNYFNMRPKIETKYQSTQKNNSKQIFQKLKETTNNDEMSKKDNTRIKKILKIKQLKQQNQIQEYHKQIYVLQDIYEFLSTIISNIRTKDSLLLHTAYQYIKLINSQRYDFIDDFINQSEQKIKRVLRMSKILQFFSIMYFLLQFNKQNLKQHYENLINSIGHSASNQIFLSKLFIMSRSVFNKQQKINYFQQSIKQFEFTTFGKQISSQEEILLRMLHNNDTIQIIQTKLGRSNFRFQNKIKDFLKVYQRENYSTRQTFIYLLEFMSYYLYSNDMVGRITFLDTAPAPYLPQTQTEDKISIIVQPYNVLYYIRNSKYYLRSYTYQFLQFLTQNFQVIFWTSQMPSQVQYVLDVIDPQQKINSKFYRYHCVNQNNLLVKDLMRLGRSLKYILLIDCDSKAYHHTPLNGIEIPWKGSQHDEKLLQLKNIIQYIDIKKLEVPEGLKLLKQQIKSLKPKLKHRKKY